MKKTILLITLLAVCLTGFKLNTSRTISGTVIDADDKQPVIGASVLVDGTNRGTLTDVKGHYNIALPDGKEQLKFSFIGYETKIVKVGKSDILNVILKPSNQSLSEVVVTGYQGVRQKSVSGSVSAIVPGSMNQLAGKLAGVQVGAPGASPNMMIRGYVTEAENNESYKGITDNSFQNTKETPLSTFSVDVDAASYSNVRRFINNGQLPPADAVRVEEMINYFSYNLTGPTNNDPVAIHTELSSAPWNTKHRLLRIGLKAKTVPTDKLPASNLVFLIDVSGSMSDANKLPLVQSSLKMLVDQLRPQDKVALVVYAGAAGVVLPSTNGDYTGHRWRL
jgi:Ca-activated chloride channel family protein